VPFQKFKRAFLVKDYWSGGACVWAPRKLGVERPSNPNDPVEYEYAFQPGRCVFLGRVGRCRIHEAKPIECRATDCSVLKHNMREEINALWEAAGSPLGRG
jgi:Fe-S-cluster containining protein